MRVLQIYAQTVKDAPGGPASPPGGVGGERPGGIAVYLQQLIEGLQAWGWQSSVLRITDRPPAALEAGDRFYEVRGFRFRIRPSVLSDLDTVLARENPDLVHLHAAFYQMHPWMLRRLRRFGPLVCTFHDVIPACFRLTKLQPDGRLCTRPLGVSCMTSGCYRLGTEERLPTDVLRVLGHLLYLGMYRRLPSILVPSRYLREVLIGNGFSAERVHVVPLFSRFEAANVTPEASDRPRVLFVGRIVPEKGIREFLGALGRLRDLPWDAVIAGDGAVRGEAERLSESLGLRDRITFAGELSADAMVRLYRSCSFVVFPSLIPESFGLVGVEAMSFGKPVVAFRAGGVPDWLEDGETGLLAEHGDVPQLAEQMRRLLAAADFRGRLGANARRRAERCFTRERHLDRVVELYQRRLATDGVSPT